MRRHLMRFFVLSSLLVLAACGGGGDDTPTSSPTVNGAEATLEVGADGSEGTRTFEDFEQLFAPPNLTPAEAPTVPPGDTYIIPIPGTLTASETEDPSAGQPFDYLRLTRTGGISTGDEANTPDEVINMEIYNDGRAFYGDFEGVVDAATIQTLTNAIDEINFFGLDGVLLGPPGDDDQYTYTVEVHRQGSVMLMSAQDRFTPPEYARFLNTILNVGDILRAQKAQAELNATATAAAEEGN